MKLRLKSKVIRDFEAKGGTLRMKDNILQLTKLCFNTINDR